MKCLIVAVCFTLLGTHSHAVFGQVPCGNASTNVYDIGSDKAAPLQFPWTVSLQMFNSTTNSWKHICSGSIIDRCWVFTAARCLDTRFTNGNLRVVVGEQDLSNSEESAATQTIVRSRDIVIHPMWSMDLLDYDYGLIQLPNQLDFSGSHSHLGPICLPTADQAKLFENMDCMISGRGLGRNSGNTTDQPDVFQKLPVHIQSFLECKKAWISNALDDRRLTSRHICVSPKRDEGTGFCRNDLGGPLQCQFDDHYVLAGVASFPRQFDPSQHPAVYARIGEVLSWISRVKAIRTRT
ncbi:chymotrypsin elastase family member 3B-like [Tropilaelaps mercedesae]|uniref:Chymotrypsin elastase family member 3B-like n=1 Tax=Tropilaelaps mercedesae TaxID=418985 RepID=A0A1V9X5A2_9ACAR|nr:chymotrypsin elastase family member 3B-like [Tropilaelaps mercedesae]